ncbi:MAG: AEC family transporter [Rhizobiaceae bacterium]
MEAIVDIVLPVFCLIAIGYLVAKFKFLDEAAGDGLANYVIKVAVPVLLVRSIATAQYNDVNPWAFIAVYFIAVLVTWFGGTILLGLIFKRGYRTSVIAGVSAAFSNLVLLGIPIVERAYGAPGLQILFFLIAFHLPIMMSMSTVLMEHAVRADGVEERPLQLLTVGRSLFRNLAKNPIIIGIFIGIMWRFSGFGVGGLAGQVMDLLARTTGPLALFSLGMGLIKYGIKGNLLPAIGLVGLSLIVMPATVLLVAQYLLPLPPLWLKVAVLLAACPTGMNAYLFATYFKIAEGLATNTIVLSLVGSVVTIPIWLSITN